MRNIKLVDVTKSGNPVIITDGAEQAHKVKVSTSANSVVKLTGKNLISYPYYQNTETTLEGITYTPNEDGTWVINGTASSGSIIYLMRCNKGEGISLPAGVYYFSGISGGGYNTYRVRITLYKEDETTITKDLYDGQEIILDVRAELRTILFQARNANVSFNNFLFNPQLEIGTIATEFEPCKATQTLIADSNGVCYFNSLYPTMVFTSDSDLIVTYKKAVEGGNEDSDNDESLKNAEIYKYRMCNYYPQVIQNILEFQAIIDSEYPEIDRLHTAANDVLSDAYLQTMSEDRISQWEQILSIRPVSDSTIEDRRETIIARIRGQGKLNSEMINLIVNTFTGGTANSYIRDGNLCVEITPPPQNKSYKFTNVEQELKNKVPAHLRLKVSRNYYTWEETKNKCSTWGDVNSSFDKWEDVLLFVPFN